MSEFNLQQAIAGARVCTKNGDEVTDLCIFESLEDPCKLVGVCQNSVYTWNTKGTFGHSANNYDLQMMPKIVTKWVVCFYKEADDYGWTSFIYDNKLAAVKYAENKIAGDLTYVIQKVEWEI